MQSLFFLFMNFLEKIRKEKGFSLYKLAKLAQTSPRQIQLLETGQRTLSLEWAQKFALILDCTPADILGYENLGIKPLKESPNLPPDSLAHKITTASGEKDDKLKKIQEIFLSKEQKPIEIKIFTQEFACGAGIEPLNYEDYTPTIFLKGILKELSPNINSLIGVRASRDSMEPIINNKDIVFVDTSKNTYTPNKNPNKSIYAFRHDNRLCIKILELHKDNPNILIASSFNKTIVNNKLKYEPFTIDLTSNTDFYIIGKVVGIFGKI